ncbi:uncharacterized protein A1O5_12073 [Cladophialophora psammophila CBS 110553]|uniref:Uncharacterized protein n=1 Tax=Cladophialophora psammophila CBS 110553 TaxID=1182543 RepID=W9VV43_9EURO|nr:uncharacterized protein A1O5_12073 [Cladophialophora psammophila CBS 110553]EXJ59448.1 hypothetical protein A1O5_12073 [Cladophialophora psammophila CBS 110553]
MAVDVVVPTDESNREAYGGQGGRQDVPGPDAGHPDHISRFDSPSSFESPSSPSLSNGSFDNSFEVGNPLARREAADVNSSRTQYASEPDEDERHPWTYFTERANSLDHMSFGEDSSGMVIPGLMDDSVLARGPGLSSDDRSILSNQYEPSFVQQSATASQVVVGAGAAFDGQYLPRFLRLTPECRHDFHHPICARCMH